MMASLMRSIQIRELMAFAITPNNGPGFAMLPSKLVGIVGSLIVLPLRLRHPADAAEQRTR